MCQRVLGPNTSLQRHIAAVHLKIKNHECAVCHRRFFRKNDCNKHLKRHYKKAALEEQAKLRLSERLKEKGNEKLNKKVKNDLNEKFK